MHKILKGLVRNSLLGIKEANMNLIEKNARLVLILEQVKESTEFPKESIDMFKRVLEEEKKYLPELNKINEQLEDLVTKL